MVSNKDNKFVYRERVYEIVRRIPMGQVMTYGQIAEILGEGYTARTVGFSMHDSDDATPWHRVINAKGACSTGRVVLPHDKQQRLLETEGVVFDQTGRCDLQRFLWIPVDKGPSQSEPRRASLFKGKPSRSKGKP